MSASDASFEEGGAPADLPPRRRTQVRVFTALGVLFAVMSVLAGGTLAFTAWQVADIDRHELTLSDVGAEEPQNYLVVGSDSREGTPESEVSAADAEVVGQRADVIMIARVDPGEGEVHLLSIPRDLWVPIAGTGHEQRINTAYASDDGRQRLIDTIEDEFDIPLHHYVEIDFRGFQGIVDSLDGIPLVFDRPVKDTNSGLLVEEPGCQVLGGEQALAFARSRHLRYLDEDGRWRTDGSGDLGRIERQQTFMRAVLERAAGERLDLGDLGDGLTLLTTVSDYVSLDAGLDLDLMGALARDFEGFSGDQLTSHSLAVVPFTTDAGAAVLELDELASQDALNVFRGRPAGSIDPSLVSVTVWNGSGQPGQAGDAEVALEREGFAVPDIDDAPTEAEATVVRYGPGTRSAAELVARYVSGGAMVEEDPTLDSAEVILVTGADFSSVLEEPTAKVLPSPDDGSDSTDESDESDESDDGPSTTSTTDGIGVDPAKVAEGGC